MHDVGLYWLQTLGCPKNQVDSDKLEGYLHAQGYGPASDLRDAELVVVNTCAFIEAARQESIEAILHLAERRAAGSRLVVTGCMAERYGDELHAALPEVDLVAGFGRDVTASSPTRTARTPVPVSIGPSRLDPEAPQAAAAHDFDLLQLPRPAARAPWAYVKVAEGCDRICGFCAIPSFRGKQRSRSPEDILAEVDASGRPQTVPLRCARSSSSRRTLPPTAATAPAPGGACASPTVPRPSPPSPAPSRCGSSAPASSTSTRRASPTS